MQDLLATALDAPTGKRSLDVPTRRLRGACARRDAWQRLSDGACSRHAMAPVCGYLRAALRHLRALRLGACCPARAAPWRLRAPRHHCTCAIIWVLNMSKFLKFSTSEFADDVKHTYAMPRPLLHPAGRPTEAAASSNGYTHAI